MAPRVCTFVLSSCRLQFGAVLGINRDVPHTILQNYITINPLIPPKTSLSHANSIVISVLATVMITRSLAALIFGTVTCMKYFPLMGISICRSYYGDIVKLSMG